MGTTIFWLVVWIFLQYFGENIYCQTLRPAIRVRLNRPVFDQASSIVQGLIEYEVPRVQIPPTRQCFAEGCVDAHSFRMASFRQPSFVSFDPQFPNKFRIRVTDFDFVVHGQLSGSITVILNIPITGTVIVTGRSIGVTAVLDLQKTVNDQPYLRFNECRIENGIVNARVANMGLLTDTVNQKMGNILSGQSRIQLEEAICENMNRLTQQHFSTRLSRIPRSISAKDLLEIIISNHVNHREKRATSDDYYDDIERVEGTPPAKGFVPQVNYRKIQISREDVINFFNIERLTHILVDLTLLDAASTSSDFSLGISGNAFSSRSHGTSPFVIPFPFRIPQNNNRRMVEVVVSDYSINSLLYHAHRTNSLIFHVDSKTPGIGNLLKTSCTNDEVCIGDEVTRVKQAYPNRKLELIIRSAQPPTIQLNGNTLNVEMNGRCIFFIEGTRQKIGVIPFTTTVLVNMKTVGNRLQGTVTIKRLDFSGHLDFLGMTASDLDGLRRTTKTALQNFVNSATAQGFPLSTATISSPLRLSNPEISFVPGSVVLQADVDLYRTLYNTN
ncbi:unnamed protein product [Caenorhabditis angaria]|uniref:Lipid-binding serum glycoprotein C-terminal domain-containing protein n=1 Tax=Caenorhabditis angaria TaxID=860376 RepID=A0A9P1N8P6_9PELO|nr:unnamed protein product [Caenorhabditis angaria]